MGDCSQCGSDDYADAGCKTTFTSNLYFDSTVDARLKFQFTNKGIFKDLDGTLTNMGANSYVGAYYEFNTWPECTVNMEVYSGIICPYPYAIRRIVFSGVSGNFIRDPLTVTQYDNNVLGASAMVGWRKYDKPKNHWAAPYVTHHSYYLDWGYDYYSIDLGIVVDLWEDTDESVIFTLPFIETREAITFDVSG